MAGLRVARLDLLGRPLRRAGQRRPDDLPRRRHLARRDPAAGAAVRATACSTAAAPVPIGRARRARRRGRARRVATRSPHALRARGIACEVAPSAAEVRQADPVRRAPRHPVRLVPRRRRRRRRGQGHPHAATRSPADPATWAPPDRRPAPAASDRPPTPRSRPRDPHPRRRHACAPTDVGQTVTLAGWVARRRDHGGVAFIDLRDASGVVQVVVRDEAVAHEPAQRVLPRRSPARSRARPEGNVNPDLATGEIEVVADRASRCSTPPRRCRSRSTSTSRSARRRGCSTATSTCAARPRPRRSGCAARSTRPPATCCDAHDFVEIETPTLTRSTPEGARDFLVPARLQPGHLVRAAAVAAAVQAAADGRRHGALLPDRPLLPRRGLPRRPAAGVHPARHRDELRRPGRRHRARPRTCSSRCGS